MKLITIITFAALALTAEAKNRRALKAGKSNKASKVEGIGHECQSCENQLPGYALFGKNYEDDAFYQNLVDLIDENDGGGLLENFDGEEPKFGEDFFVPGPFRKSTDDVTCYDDKASLITCGLITFIGEAIYRSELLSCLYTQIVTFARDETECQLDSNGRKRRLLSDRQKEAVDRVLESGITDPQQQDTMAAMAMLGAESLLDLSEILGLECGSTENAFIEKICNGGENRKLSLPDVEGLPIASGVVSFLEFVDETDADIAMAIQDNLFFGTCGFGNTICAALFGLLKTFDAIICRFRDERDCGSESCTKDLAFDVNFQAERLIIDLPFFEDFDVSRFLAPCDYCLAGKSNGCAAFCPYYESISKCPPPFSSGAFNLSEAISGASEQ